MTLASGFEFTYNAQTGFVCTAFPDAVSYQKALMMISTKGQNGAIKLVATLVPVVGPTITAMPESNRPAATATVAAVVPFPTIALGTKNVDLPNCVMVEGGFAGFILKLFGQCTQGGTTMVTNSNQKGNGVPDEVSDALRKIIVVCIEHHVCTPESWVPISEAYTRDSLGHDFEVVLEWYEQNGVSPKVRKEVVGIRTYWDIKPTLVMIEQTEGDAPIVHP